jgi:hypothetical protein
MALKWIQEPEHLLVLVVDSHAGIIAETSPFLEISGSCPAVP